MLNLLLAAVLPGLAPAAQSELSFPTLGDARVVATAGDWSATLEVFPIPESARMQHAPRPAWQLARVFEGRGEPQIVAVGPGYPGRLNREQMKRVRNRDESASPLVELNSFVPGFVAIGADGTLAATSTSWPFVLRVSPDGVVNRITRKESDGQGWSWGHLGMNGIVDCRRHEGGGYALAWRDTHTDGFGPPVELGSAASAYDPPRFLEAEDRLLWIRSPDEFVEYRVSTSKLRIHRHEALDGFSMDAVHDDWLFARSNRRDHTSHLPAPSEVQLVHLETGKVLRMPWMERIEGFDSTGFRTRTQHVDPVAGTITYAAPDELTRGFDFDSYESELIGLLEAREQNILNVVSRRPELPYSARHVDLLVRVAREAADTNDRNGAIHNLGYGPPAYAGPALVQLLDELPTRRRQIIRALGRIGDGAHSAAIRSAVPVEEARHFAGDVAAALCILGSQESAPYVAALAERYSDGRIDVALQMLRERSAFREALDSIRKR